MFVIFKFPDMKIADIQLNTCIFPSPPNSFGRRSCFSLSQNIYNNLKMSTVNAQQLLPLLKENVWREATQYMEAETRFQEFCAKKKSAGQPSPEVMTSSCKLVNEIALARQRIQNTLKDIGDNNYKSGDWMERIDALEKDNRSLSQKLEALTIRVQEYTNRICTLEKTSQSCNQCRNSKTDTQSALKSDNLEENEDDVDLFGSDEETEEEKRIKQERVKAYEDKKSKKKQVVAKSSIVLDIKPWYDTTDLQAMEQEVRKIKNDGLKWGASSLIPMAYGIRKLQIVATVEDELVSVDWLQETIQEEIEALVQSVDIVAFNKL